MYKVLVYLSNAVYYLHYGKQSTAIQAKARENIRLFAKAYRLLMGKKACIPKYHWSQHLVELVIRHGPAFLTDGFCLERLLGMFKGTTTTSVNHIAQMFTNFLLKFHSPLLIHMERFEKLNPHGTTRQLLRDMGFDPSFFVSMGCFGLNEPETSGEKKTNVPKTVPKEHELLVRRYLEKILPESFEMCKLKRWLRVKFRNVILTSSMFQHDGNVRDCFCVVEEVYPGQIIDICSTEDESIFLIVMLVFKKKVRTNGTGIPYLTPDNQFPVQETREKRVFHLNIQLFLQKALYISDFYMLGDVENVFCVCPNEFFEF